MSVNDWFGATAGVARVPRHPFARPFRERHRLRYPDIVRCSLSAYGPAKAGPLANFLCAGR